MEEVIYNKECEEERKYVEQMEEAMKEMEKADQSAEIDARAQLMIDPDTGFGDRFEAVMLDLLNGNHISQTELDDPGLYREIVDDEGKDDPADDF